MSARTYRVDVAIVAAGIAGRWVVKFRPPSSSDSNGAIYHGPEVCVEWRSQHASEGGSRPCRGRWRALTICAAFESLPDVVTGGEMTNRCWRVLAASSRTKHCAAALWLGCARFIACFSTKWIRRGGVRKLAVLDCRFAHAPRTRNAGYMLQLTCRTIILSAVMMDRFGTAASASQSGRAVRFESVPVPATRGACRPFGEIWLRDGTVAVRQVIVRTRKKLPALDGHGVPRLPKRSRRA